MVAYDSHSFLRQIDKTFAKAFRFVYSSWDLDKDLT